MDINTIQEIIQQYGLISIFILVMLEYANVPLPSEIVLSFVGIMVASGNIDLYSAVLVSILAGVIGSIINYYIGLYFGKPVIKYVLKKFPKTRRSVNSSMNLLKKHDKSAVLLARAIPLARTFISIPAGILKMNIFVFTIYSTIGISVWNFILIYLGYILGDNIHQIIYIMETYSIIVVATFIMCLGIYYIKNKKVKL
jgi:membrane protein DedA with SNARE-associated domain